MRGMVAAAVVGLALASTSAWAEVTAAAPGAFMIEAEANLQAAPDRAWAAIGEIGRWWSSEHTYSSDAANLSLDPQAGGCFCERWGDGQSVEHGRVVLVRAQEGVRTLRFIGALGPLQETGVVGVMTFSVSPEGEGAKITMHYRASGDPGLGLDAMAQPVDHVLTEQFGRLVRYTETGAPS